MVLKQRLRQTIVDIDRKTIIKAIVLILLLAGAIVAVRVTGLQYYLTKESLRSFVDQFGIFGPVVYVLIFAAAVALLLPATPFTIAGAILFGPWLGVVLNVAAVTLGSLGGFTIARTLGRDFARRVAGNTLAKYDEKLEKHGFATIFYLRLILVPLAPVNYGAGLTRVKVRDFFLGTLLGVIPASFIIMLFVSRLTDVSHWTQFLTWDVLFAVVLFIGSFFIPMIVKKYFRKEHILDVKKKRKR